MKIKFFRLYGIMIQHNCTDVCKNDEFHRRIWSLVTPDLSQEFNPRPKPPAKGKKLPHPIGSGKKVTAWEVARVSLIKLFTTWSITTCEIKLDGICIKDNFLGFAHTERRRKLSEADVKSPEKVVLACQPCHHVVDFVMDRTDAKLLLEKIIKERIIT